MVYVHKNVSYRSYTASYQPIIHLSINSALQEMDIQIHTKEYNEQIEKLMKQLQATPSTMIDGYCQQEIHMLKISDIYSIYAEGAKVFLQTEEQEFETKRKLQNKWQLLGSEA